MTHLANSTPKQMTTMITLLNLVKRELFITIDHAECCLEMFISERQSNASLQQFIQALQKIRGTLTLVEITGATQLTELMLQRSLDIPSGANDDWDNTLSTLSTSLFTLRRYLENFENYPCSLSELLIPITNELRQTNKQMPLSDSYFYDITLTLPPLPNSLATDTDLSLFCRLRQMYQIGLLGLIKDQNRDASLRMMSRSMDRLQQHLNNQNAAMLCWVTSAALESFTDSEMTAYSSRKKLFSRVDQHLRNTQINHENINESLLKDLLYIVSLDNTLGTKALAVFKAFNLTPLPYNNKILETEIAKLIGLGQNTILSFTAAVREELADTQNTINSFTNNTTDHSSLINTLLNNLAHLIKTLSLAGLQPAQAILTEQIDILATHKDDTPLSSATLDKLADTILHVESAIISYETNASHDNNEKAIVNNTLSNQYFKQGCSLTIQESITGINNAQQNIIAYIESEGNKQYLEKLPQLLNEIYGCFLFLNQHRAAKIIQQCAYYINNYMINSDNIPATQQLDNLADILTSLEFYMETSTFNSTTTPDANALDLAEESLATLNVPNIESKKNPLDSSPIVNKQPIITETVSKPIPNTAWNNKKNIPPLEDTNQTEDLQAVDFDLGKFSSFSSHFNAAPAPEPIAAAIPPALQKNKPLVPTTFTLEPLEEQTQQEEEEENNAQLTRPKNWTLS